MFMKQLMNTVCTCSLHASELDQLFQLQNDFIFIQLPLQLFTSKVNKFQ